MKNNFRLGLLFFAFSLCLFSQRLSAEQELLFLKPQQAISMDFQDVRLKDLLKIFSIQSGLNFIASEAVQERTITLYLDKVPVQEAMDKIFKANNLSYELDRGSNIFIVKDWGKPQIETVTKVFYLKYYSVPSSNIKREVGSNLGAAGGDIVSSIKEILSENGKISEDTRTNSLIITDIPSRMPIIEKTLAMLDVPQPQVMLEVEMLDVSKNTVDKIGFEFGSNPFTLIFPGGIKGLDFFIGDVSDRGKTSIDSSTAGSLIMGRNYARLLDFLKTQTDTKYLARPRILTLNNETAEIKIATNEAIGLNLTTTSAGGTTGSTTAQAERTETGVVLRVTPQVNMETGEITMFIYPKVSDATGGTEFILAGESYAYRNPEERSTKSIVRIKDGETVIIGGLIRNEFSEKVTKLPILGDIPLLGTFFRHKNKDKDKARELLVFITPHIVKESGLELAQARKIIPLPQREQNTVSAVDRQAIVDSSLNNFEKKRR